MALVCDDKKLCTDDTCDKLKGCQYPNNTKACDDGDACTKADTCAAGSCVGTESYPAALVVASPGNQDAFRGVTALSVNNSPALAAVGEVSEGGKRHGKLLISNAEGKAVKDFPAITPQLGAGILNAIAADGAGVVAVGAMGKDDAALQNGGGLDAWFVRASATQVQTNVKLPDTGGDEMLRGVVARGDGTFWGLGNRYAAGKDQGYLPLITANGTCQVNCSTGFSHKDATGDSFQAGVALPDGGVLVFGYALGGGSKNEDGALWRFDKGGKALFVSLLGSAQNDQFFGAAGLPDGTAVGLGTSDGQGWIVRVSPEGLVSVNEQVAGTTELWSVVPHAGGFAVAGVNAQGGLLAGLDSGGLKLWQANHGKVLRGLAPIGGGFGLAGAVAGANADPQDAALLRTDAWGFASCAAAGKCAGVTQCDDGKPCTDGVCTPGAGCGFSSAANGQGCDDGAACSALDACAGGNCGAGKARLYAVNAGGTAKNDSFFGAAPAPDGGLVVAGETAHNDPATIKRILRAYWPDGSVRFQTTFAPEGTAGGASDSLHDVKAMPGGGYVVAGRTIPPGAAFSEFHSWLAYVSENGWINWSQSYPNNVVAKNPDSLSRMVVGPDGTIAAVGSYNFDTTARLLVVNRSGGVVTDTIKTAGYFKDIAAAPGGGYWIVGQTSDANVDATVTRVSSQNEWTQYKFGSVGTDESFSGVVADAGGITAFGNKAGGAQTGWVARIDNNGKLVWERLTANVYAAVVPASDGGFFAAGSMLGASGPGHVPAVFRLQTDGTAHWQAATSAAEGQWRGLALGGSSTLLLGGYTADKSVGGEDLMVGVVDNFGNPSCTASGTCLTTLPSACTDTNPCTADTCTGGKCANPPGGDGNACDDGQPCEVQDICLNGKCSPGKPLLFGPSKYGTVGYDVYNAVTSTADGGTIAVGVFGDKDGIIDRRDAAGASMWPTKLSGGAAVEFQGVAPLGGGQFVVVGSASNASPGPVIMYTMAFDSNGSKVWDHKPANKARATFLGVSARADGSFVGCGFEDAANTTWRTVSYNKAGQVVAEKMGDTGNAAAGLIAHSCLATADGGYWLVGGKWPEPVGNYYTDSKADGLVVRVNKDNVIDVQTTVGSPGFHEVLRGVALAPDGLVVAGHSAAPGGKGGTDIWVAKLDPAGKLVAGSERRYGGAKDDLAWAIAAVPGGTFAVVGRGHPGATPVPHGWFGHLDANLNLVCEKFPDLGAESHWLGVTYVSPGRMAMAGRIRGNVPTDFDASLAVVDLACNAKCADSGSCATTPPNACNDNDPCTLDACSKGVCSKTPLNCDDGNPCTIDSCKAGVGCVTKPKCNVEKCVGSVHEFADTCDANGICIDGGTEDCQPSTCDAAGLKCLAKCVPGAVGGQCDDGNACTDDRCANSGLACSNAAISGPCTDGNACTDVDVCTNGACKAGASKTCNDNIACTTDSCDAKTGACVFTPGPTCPLWDKGKWDTDKWQ